MARGIEGPKIMPPFLGWHRTEARFIFYFKLIHFFINSFSLSIYKNKTKKKHTHTHTHTHTHRPIAAIIACSCFSLAFSAIPFVFLVQVYLILRLINIIAEYAALIYLRHTEPHANRPYKQPGGLIGAYLLATPTLIISGFALFTADLEALYVGGGLTAAIVLVYYFRHVYKVFRAFLADRGTLITDISFSINEVL